MKELEIYFKKVSMDRLIELNRTYQGLIDIEEGRYTPGVYPLSHKEKAGQRMPYPPKMPWMLPAWKYGLMLAQKVLAERKRNESKK